LKSNPFLMLQLYHTGRRSQRINLKFKEGGDSHLVGCPLTAFIPVSKIILDYLLWPEFNP
jgi:hypothetical protein